jgi:UDP-glucose 4-epimerase
MRVAVTGGAGFIGKHVLDWLTAHEHEVMVIDDLSRGRLEHVPPHMTLLKIDLSRITASKLARHFDQAKVEAVMHLAATHFIPDCMRDPERTFEINVKATHTLLEAVRFSAVSKVVFASTGDVYAVADRVHIETETLMPSNIYGLTKVLSEQMLEYAVRVGICESAVVLRLANVYGPNETNPHVIPDAIERIVKREEPSLVMGYLGSARDFVYVKDVARAFGLAATRAPAGFWALNTGTGHSIPVRTVIRTLQDRLGDERPLLENPAAFRQFDRVSLTPNVDAIARVLGWRAETQLAEGLRATIQGVRPKAAEQAA